MAEIQLKRCGGGGEQSFANFQQISFDFAYFLITTEKYGNDRNDFLQIVSTEPCRSLNVDRASDLFGQVIKKICKIKTKLRKALLPPSSIEFPPLYICCNIHHFGITKRKVMTSKLQVTASKLQVTPTKLQVTRSKFASLTADTSKIKFQLTNMLFITF